MTAYLGKFNLSFCTRRFKNHNAFNCMASFAFPKNAKLVRKGMQRLRRGRCKGGWKGYAMEVFHLPTSYATSFASPVAPSSPLPSHPPSNPLRIQENMFYNNAKPQGDNDEYIHLIFLHNNLKKNTFLDAEHHVNHFSPHTCIFACTWTNIIEKQD